MGSAVRRCPRRALAHAEHIGDNRMSGITMNALPTPSMTRVDGFLSQPRESHNTRLAYRRLRSSVAVISAHGHIDASNADTLTEYILGHLMDCRGLVIDLRGLDFFGTEGFSALHRVSVCCARPWHRLGSSTQCGSLPGAADRRPTGLATRRKHRRGSEGDDPRPASPSTKPPSCRWSCVDGGRPWGSKMRDLRLWARRGPGTSRSRRPAG